MDKYDFKRAGINVLTGLGLITAGTGAAGGCATGCVGVGLVGKIISVGLASATCALAGEVVDHLPYLSTAVPQGLEFMANMFYDAHIAEKLTGNMDKLGAGLGFFGSVAGSYFRSSQTNNVNQEKKKEDDEQSTVYGRNRIR